MRNLTLKEGGIHLCEFVKKIMTCYLYHTRSQDERNFIAYGFVFILHFSGVHHHRLHSGENNIPKPIFASISINFQLFLSILSHPPSVFDFFVHLFAFSLWLQNFLCENPKKVRTTKVQHKKSLHSYAESPTETKRKDGMMLLAASPIPRLSGSRQQEEERRPFRIRRIQVKNANKAKQNNIFPIAVPNDALGATFRTYYRSHYDHEKSSRPKKLSCTHTRASLKCSQERNLCPRCISHHCHSIR